METKLIKLRKLIQLIIILILIQNYQVKSQDIDDFILPQIEGGQSVCGNLEDYIPTSNTPILEFNVNVHLYNDGNGHGMYENVTPADVQTLINNLNTYYSSFQAPVVPVSPPAQIISDSRIRFYLTNVYIINNTSLYDINSANSNSGNHSPVNSATEINIYYFSNSQYNGHGGNASNFIVNMINFSNFSGSTQILAHELGHILGLNHTFLKNTPCDPISGVILDDGLNDTYYPDPNVKWKPAINGSLNPQYTGFVACDGNKYYNISNNLMGYNSTRNYLSPLQMAIIHQNASNYSDYMSKLRNISVYNQTASIAISTSSIWNGAVVIKGDLVINPGATLTINCNVFFTSQGKIIVKPGGKLIVNGGRLTSTASNTLWQGIFVGGNPQQDQFPTSMQGICIVNNATLENMNMGICNLNYPINGIGGISGSGGIIKASGTNFINNNYGINLYPYQNKRPSGYIANDFSYINNCTFKMNFKANNLLPQMQYTSFVRLNGVKGIRLLGNNYIMDDKLKTTRNPHQWPVGINSVNASFTVDDYCLTPALAGGCTSSKTSSFKNLFYGIRAFNYDPGKSVKVNNTTFFNVYRGIYLSSVDNSSITYNLFRLLPLDNTWNDNNVTDKQPYGLYLDASTGFLVTKNTFNMFQGYTYDQNQAIIINNSGDQINSIYDNEFTNMYVGINAQNWNRSTVSEAANYANDGLKIGCNDFIFDVKKNVLIVGDGNNTGNYGISTFQGRSITNPNKQYMLAGNTFTNTGYTTDWDFFNQFNSAMINYYTHDYSISPPAPDGSVPKWVPQSNKNIIIERQTNSGFYDKTNTCPLDPSLLSRTYTDIRNDIVAYKAQLQSSILILSIWQDGGQSDLPEEIVAAYPWETYQLYNDLMLESPYLSDESIIAAINNVGVLPDALLKLVIIANPHAISSPDVKKAIDNRIPALSQNTYDEIMGHIEDYSPLRDLKADVAYWAQEYFLTFNEFKRTYTSDSVNTWANDSLNAMLSREEKISLQLELASNYFYQGNTTSYSELLNEWSPQNEDDIMQKAEFLNFFSLIDNFDYNTVENTNVDPQDKDALILLANTGKSKYANYARAVLLNIDQGYSYYESILDYTEGSTRMAKNNDSNSEFNEEKDIVKIYPNPAANYILIESLSDNSNLSYSIFSSDGKVIKSSDFEQSNKTIVVDLSELSNGSYIVLIKNGKQIVDKKTIQVIR